jgi:hypothetical protein
MKLIQNHDVNIQVVAHMQQKNESCVKSFMALQIDNLHGRGPQRNHGLTPSNIFKPATTQTACVNHLIFFWILFLPRVWVSTSNP